MEQCQPPGSSRPFLHLGVSAGFTTFETIDPSTRTDGGIDLTALVSYLNTFSPVDPPSADRVNELPPE